MKKLGLFAAIIAVPLLFQASIVSAQRRPVRKPPTTTAPTLPVTKPTPKAASPAEEFFNQGLKCEAKDYDCQVSNYTKAINLNLATKAVFQKRAEAYLGREEYEKAIGDLTKVVELDPNDAGGFKERGNAYLGMPRSSQNLKNAIKDFTSAIDLEPKDVEAYNLRGSAYLAIGKPENANADLDKALSLAPANFAKFIERADGFLATKDYEKAIELYGRAINLEPSRAEGYTKRANVHLLQNNPGLAAVDISKAIQIEPKNPATYAVRAQLYESEKKYKEAVADYTSSIELNPKSAATYLQRGDLLTKQGKFDDAIRDYDRAAELDPRNARPYESRCKAEVKRGGSSAKAVQDCSIAIAIDPTVEDAYIYRARIFDLESRALQAVYKEPPQSMADRIRGRVNMWINANREITNGIRTAGTFLRRASGYPPSDGSDWTRVWANQEKDYTTAIELDPTLVEAYVGRAIIRAYRQDELGKLQDLRAAIGLEGSALDLTVDEQTFVHWSSDVQTLELALKSNPANLTLLLQRAFAIRDNDKAQENAFRKILDLYDASEKGPLQMKALIGAVDMLAAIANDTERKRKSIDAGFRAKLEFIDQAIRKWPTVPGLYYSRGFPMIINKIKGSEVYYAKAYELETEWRSGLPTTASDTTIPIPPQTLQRFAELKRLKEDQVKGLAVAMGKGGAVAGGMQEQPSEASKPELAEYERVVRLQEEATAIRFQQEVESQRKVDAIMAKMYQEMADISAADAKRRREEKARRDSETIQALGNLVSTVVQVATAKTSPNTSGNQTRSGQTTRKAPNPTSTVNSTNSQSNSSGRHKYIRSAAIESADNEQSFFGCSTDSLYKNQPQYKHCWSPWTSLSGNLTSVQVRALGPIGSTGNFINDDPNRRSHHWFFGFRNSSNSIIYVSGEFVIGGERLDASALLGPGQYIKLSGSAQQTFSASNTWTFVPKEYEICTNISRAPGSGVRAWQCNEQ